MDQQGTPLEQAATAASDMVGDGGASATASSTTQSGSGDQPEQGSTLYVGNLHPLCSQKSLEDLCRLFGEVIEVKIVKDKLSQHHSGFGFVKYRDRATAAAALRSLNGKAYLGQALRVHWAFQSPHGREDTSHHFHVFVGDLGQEVTDGMLYSTACSIGDCSDARVMWDHATGRSKGYGFISFRNKDDAQAAVGRLNGACIGSRRVRCGWAAHKQEDGPAPDFSTIDKQDPFNTNIYVGNTPPGWNEQELTRHFSAYGEIVEVKLHKKGAYGFVRFSQHADAVKAIVSTHSNMVGGRTLKCSWGKASMSPSASGNQSAPQQAVAAGLMMMPGLQQASLGLQGGLLHPSLLNSHLLGFNPTTAQQVLTGVPLGLNGQLALGGQQPASPSSALTNGGLAQSQQLAFLQGRGGQVAMQSNQALGNFTMDPTGAAGLQPGAYNYGYYQ